MNYSMLAFCMTLTVCGFFSLLHIENNTGRETTEEQAKAGQFIHYVDAFDAYHQKNPTATGEVTPAVIIPPWLPTHDNIKMVIDGGVGYVYTPASKGVMREVIEWTGNSASVGLSDAAYIYTVSGKIQKPSFIGSGYIVYVR